MPYAPTTKITRQDLQVFPSERLTDNDDGGGMPIGKALTGADNELYDPISAIAWLNGGFYARLVYMGVRRVDDEPLLGPYAAITVPAKNPNVSYLMFPATKYGELRHEAMKRIESYVVGTIESRMTMLSTQSQNSKIVQAYQRVGEPLPLIGDVYELRQEKAGYKTASQYIKVIRVESEDRTFVDPRSQAEFTRTVVKMEISTKLEEDFVGVDYPDQGYVNNPCKIRETHVADAANYYGVKPIAEAITKGSTKIKVSSIMEKLAPTNNVSTPLLDQTAAGQRQSLYDAAKPDNAGLLSIDVNKSHQAGTTTNLFIGNAATPNTVRITSNAGDITDKAGALIHNDKTIGNIDYANAEITINEPGFSASLYKAIFRPAAADLKVADTAKIDITINNRSTEYSITIDPPPALGSLQASYRSLNNWYDLKDDGTGALRGISAQHGSGNLNNTTGTVNVSLGALPDVGSAIHFSWSNKGRYFNRSDVSATAKMILELQQDADPASIQLSWNDGAAKTATCDATGAITGDWTGKYNPQDRKISIDTGANFNHPAGVLEITANYSKGEKTYQKHQAPLRAANGSITLDLGNVPLKPNTVKLKWNLLIENYNSPITTNEVYVPNRNWVDPYKTVRDDGNGKLVDETGVEVGTIDYAARRLTFKPETTVKIPKAKYKNVVLGQQVSSDGNGTLTKTTRRVLFSHYEYIPAGASMPIDESGFAEVWFYDTSPTSTVTETLNSGSIEIDLLENYAEVIAPASVNFTWGAKRYYDKLGSIYTDLDPKTGNATLAGTLNNQTGKVTLKNWQWTNGADPVITSLATTVNGNPVDAVTFRTPKAPLTPNSLKVRALALDGTLLTARAAISGEFNNNSISGNVDVEYGVASLRFGELVTAAGNESQPWYDADAVENGKIWKPRHVFAETIIYNAGAYTYLPIDSNIVKIDTVRLPQDGRVPIYRRGDSILISNSKTDDIGSAFQSGQTINLSRNDIDRVCVKDADKKPVNAELWTYDLDVGSITFATPLDLSSYKMPLSVTHTRQQRNRLLNADIDGTLELMHATNRDYAIENTYVSSLIIDENLQVRHSIPFTQRSWDEVWRDEPVGNQLLNKLNLTDHPMVLTDNGAITQKWLIKFISSTQFELYGDTLGYVGTYDTLTDLAPMNPWTDVPYFTIPKEAFGANATWASQDIIRVNTWGTLMAIWILCAAQPTPDVQEGTDGFTYCFFGDTTEI